MLCVHGCLHGGNEIGILLAHFLGQQIGAVHEKLVQLRCYNKYKKSSKRLIFQVVCSTQTLKICQQQQIKKWRSGLRSEIFSLKKGAFWQRVEETQVEKSIMKNGYFRLIHATNKFKERFPTPHFKNQSTEKMNFLILCSKKS